MQGVKQAITLYKNKNGLGKFMPKTVLFDMDGTLCNSMPNHAVAWTRALKKYGVEFTAEDAYLTEGARGIDTIRKYVFAQRHLLISEDEAQEIYDEKARVFATLPVAAIMDGAFELMEKAISCGMITGIVTGSAQRPLIARIISDFGKYISEDRIVTAFDVDKGKPDPEPYLQGMKKCGGVKPEETIIIENAPLGVKSGSASGAFTIAVNTGPLQDNLLLSEGADILFHTLTEAAENWDILTQDILNADK